MIDFGKFSCEEVLIRGDRLIGGDLIRAIEVNYSDLAFQDFTMNV